MTNREGRAKLDGNSMCDVALRCSLSKCPLLRVSENFYGVLILKFVNGEVKQMIREESLQLK